MSRELIPEEALDVLGQARWDRDATRQLELLSLSFYWSDEMLFEFGISCLEHDPENFSFKDLILYRESLNRGKPDEQYQDVWEQVREACPQWPGFREDRCSTELGAALDSSIRRECASIERDLRERESTDV